MLKPVTVETTPPESAGSRYEAHREASRRAAVYVDRGLLLFAAGHSAIAAGMFRHAISLNPHRALAHYVLGVTLKAMGRDQEAVLEWRAALEAGEEDADGDWVGSRARHLLALAEEEGRGVIFERAAGMACEDARKGL